MDEKQTIKKFMPIFEEWSRKMDELSENPSRLRRFWRKIDPFGEERNRIKTDLKYMERMKKVLDEYTPKKGVKHPYVSTGEC